MQENKLQNFSDNIINAIFLWAIPKSVKPNTVTYIRFITTPTVFWLLVEGNFKLGIPAFIICASTDFIDGAMARKRNQITEQGKILDPLADKLLIGSSLAAIGFDYFIVRLIVVFILLEFIVVLSYSLFFKKTLGRPEGANAFGKVKMILQSLAIVGLLVGIIYKNDNFIEASSWILGFSFAFAIVSGYEQIRDRLAFLHSDK
ncbi:CDP-alcohol phosphatidyltransferase family protein [bacterium]|nr:CDP-alcohol phosphatidyltransferase family protein [bacterium]